MSVKIYASAAIEDGTFVNSYLLKLLPVNME